jgi:hypothetical protein
MNNNNNLVTLEFIVKNAKHERININGIVYNRYYFNYDEYPDYKSIEPFAYVGYFTDDYDYCKDTKTLELQYQRRSKLDKISNE